MMPSDKDFAEFARDGLIAGLFKADEVQKWADRIIAERAEVPDWAIELSTAGFNEMISVLGEVPGDHSGGVPDNLMAALIRRRVRNGEIKPKQLRGVVSKLDVDWARVLGCVSEEFEAGYVGKAHIRAQVEEMLAPYAEYETYLATWT
jgi:hypothetical protein